MTKDEIEKLVVEAGWPLFAIQMLAGTEDEKRLQRFAELVAAAEREACAKVCEEQFDLLQAARAAQRVAYALTGCDEDETLRALRHESDVRLYNCGIEKCAAAIRAKGNA